MPALKPPFRLTQGQRHFVLLALALVCASFAVWSVLQGEMTLRQRLYPSGFISGRATHLHLRGISLWIMAGAILMFAACLAAAVVAEQRTPPGQKANQSLATTLGVIAIVTAVLMMSLASLGFA